MMKCGKLESFAHDVVGLPGGKDSPVVQRAGLMLSRTICAAGRQSVSVRVKDKQQFKLVSP